MSTSDTGLAETRWRNLLASTLQLPEHEFTAALQAARDYHLEHPPGELVSNGDTNEDMELHHLEAAMMPLLRKNIPYTTAEAIVTELVLPLKPAEKEPAQQ
jgi:hypothetical protein